MPLYGHSDTLCRPATADLVKFYGCELGAQTKYDKKSGTSIVNGAHDTSKLCELLEVCRPCFILRVEGCTKHLMGSLDPGFATGEQDVSSEGGELSCGALMAAELHQEVRAVLLLRQPRDDRQDPQGEHLPQVQGVRRGLRRGHAPPPQHLHPEEPARGEAGQGREEVRLLLCPGMHATAAPWRACYCCSLSCRPLGEASPARPHTEASSLLHARRIKKQEKETGISQAIEADDKKKKKKCAPASLFLLPSAGSAAAVHARIAAFRRPACGAL
jgi:hypothetical protein